MHDKLNFVEHQVIKQSYALLQKHRWRTEAAGFIQVITKLLLWFFVYMHASISAVKLTQSNGDGKKKKKNANSSRAKHTTWE
jgi:uncharacterized membrane protein required for colicin V production